METIAPALVDSSDTPRPGLGDGTVSNLLLHQDGRVLVVGGTLAGLYDPAYIVGCLVAELDPHLADAHAVAARFWGPDAADPAVLERAVARARLWSVVDDLRWLHLSRLATARCDDDELVPLLYGGFRARRALHLLRSPDLETWMHLS